MKPTDNPDVLENCQRPQASPPATLLGITDTDRMDWLERQHPNTLIVENGIVTNSLRLMVDEMIKRERAAVMPNAEVSRSHR